MRGYYGIGIENPKTASNIGTLWRSAAAFGASFMVLVGTRYQHQYSDTVKAWKHIPLFHYNKIGDMEVPHGCVLVGVEIVDHAEDIVEFKHPERALYLLGAEDKGLSESAIRHSDKLIKIPSIRCLNVAVAGSIVMYDRVAQQARGAQ